MTAASMLDRWLTEQADLFPQTDARDVVVPWLHLSRYVNDSARWYAGRPWRCLSSANAALAKLGMTDVRCRPARGLLPSQFNADRRKGSSRLP